MLDVLGAMAIASVAVLAVGVLALMGAWQGAARRRFVVVSAAWFVTVAALGLLGVFSRPAGVGTLAVGAAVMAPIIAATIGVLRTRSVRAVALSVPLAVLVALHVGRLAGGLFVALHAAGRLPPTFALTAGWGDIFVALAAIPVAWAIHARARGWRSMAWGWNAVGALDLIAAVSLGIGSAPDSPVRFIFERPDAGTVASLPWVMIPGFLVPMYLLSHAAIFAQLALRSTKEGRLPLRSAA